jgi:hypothetical protein
VTAAGGGAVGHVSYTVLTRIGHSNTYLGATTINSWHPPTLITVRDRDRRRCVRRAATVLRSDILVVDKRRGVLNTGERISILAAGERVRVVGKRRGVLNTGERINILAAGERVRIRAVPKHIGVRRGVLRANGPAAISRAGGSYGRKCSSLSFDFSSDHSFELSFDLSFDGWHVGFRLSSFDGWHVGFRLFDFS